jgi:transposase, IS5 family
MIAKRSHFVAKYTLKKVQFNQTKYMSQYFKKTGENLFCQDFLIEGALAHSNQFLKKLDLEVNFEKLWHEKLLQTYKGGAEIGQPPYRPAQILKMLFLAYLFGTSEREIERIINDSISMKAFLHISLDEAAPDHSTLTKFKNRILAFDQRNATNLLKEFFDEIIILAQIRGVDLGFTQSIDSTHTIANVNNGKERERTKKISEGGKGKKLRDPDSKYGVKKTKNVKTTKGEKVEITEGYVGYKSHFSVSAISNLITSYLVTTMAAYDGHFFEPLMKDDLKKGVAKRGKTTYGADRGYDDGENHVWLETEKLKDAICLKGIQTGETPIARWTKHTTQEEFDAGRKQRYTVERVNGSVKKDHGLGRARYLGLQKMALQTSLTALAHNLKTLVKLWTGIPLRGSLVHVS